jgi:hypothetical protein
MDSFKKADFNARGRYDDFMARLAGFLGDLCSCHPLLVVAFRTDSGSDFAIYLTELMIHEYLRWCRRLPSWFTSVVDFRLTALRTWLMLPRSDLERLKRASFIALTSERKQRWLLKHETLVRWHANVVRRQRTAASVFDPKRSKNMGIRTWIAWLKLINSLPYKWVGDFEIKFIASIDDEKRIRRDDVPKHIVMKTVLLAAQENHKWSNY